jgi:hypothetical protein
VTEAGAPPSRAQPAPRRSALRLTLLLALLLLLVGLAGAGALRLLLHAMRPPTADDTAQLVCTAFTQQNYDLLVAQVDPAPVPPAATGRFDANALRTQLTTLDGAQGKVTTCSYKQLAFSNLASGGTSLQYIFTIHRAQTSAPVSLVMILVHEADGSWKLSRGSDFLGNPA